MAETKEIEMVVKCGEKMSIILTILQLKTTKNFKWLLGLKIDFHIKTLKNSLFCQIK